MEDIRADRARLASRKGLHKFRHDSLQHSSPMHLLAMQGLEDGVPHRHSNLGGLFRIQQWNQEFQEPHIPLIFVVGEGVAFLRIQRALESLHRELILPSGPSGSVTLKFVGGCPEFPRPRLQLPSFRQFELIGSPGNKLFNQLLTL